VTLTPAAVVLSVFVLTSVGPATAQLRIQRFSVELKPHVVVPRPLGGAQASGIFSASFAPHRDVAQLRFNLTYSGLTGLATSAHIHLGKPGATGPVLIHLCRPGGAHCGFAYNWTSGFTSDVFALARARGAYVDVHTAHNPRGELRGQIVIRP
jgi:hypothetical protein